MVKFFEEEVLVVIILVIVGSVLIVNWFWVGVSGLIYCGNGVCDNNETGFCHVDCDWCGDGYCQIGEDCSSCSRDCSCGVDFLLNDNKCESVLGENCRNSDEDCGCESGKRCNERGVCEGFCGNKICEKIEERVCKLDCSWCGDGYCKKEEDCFTCSKDCGSCENEYCGDGYCLQGECDVGCWKDCSFAECSNGICEPEKNENCANSPVDCKCFKGICNSETKRCIYQSCGNLICEENEDYLSCPNDCEYDYVPEDLSDVNYPLVFVHGHSFTEEDMGYSINIFKEFQDKLETEGHYFNKGIVLPSTKISENPQGVWYDLDKPISIRMTYYAGAYDKYGSFIGPEDNQHIEIYAERLEDIIDKILYFSGKNKVNIIAYSMGGLVARWYIKDNSNYVNKLVLIATPNKGTKGYVGEFCDEFHPGPECDDMLEGSDFLKDLNEGGMVVEGVDYLSVIGISDSFYSSCEGGGSDDVICNSSAYLESGENFYVIGYEGGLMVHSAMVKPSETPEVYEEVVRFLVG